ncbi:hypothetical protein GFY24_10905 [Nocardia sp. SYP-A9097]|uniref:CAP domain-containing protein n=1 Tax=Nocardia sp. SYP-A9097 TaxID=2663237 RepID=UPI00129B64EC|nr:CAP domain-containing protein [Nocardia sp. SYP-A9097]MRH87949.1 hypothetical protein [Nocardia sp. SYP-A9097]
MSRRTLAAALAISAGAVLFTVPSTASANGYINCDVDQHSLTLRGEEPEVFDAINRLRADNGVGAVTHTEVLSRPSAWTSNDSAERGYVPSDHLDSLGRNIGLRFRECGVPAIAQIAEINYGGTNITPADAMEFWANSPAHRAIMLDGRLTRVGVSVVDLDNHQYWTVAFASVA